MKKCPQCRKHDVELNTIWERFKNWIFRKAFAQDVIDLSQEKYTQGFGDGYEVGRKHERTTADRYKDLYPL